MQFARLLSFVFHPLWMPLVTYYSVYLLDDSVLLTPHGHYLILLLLCLSIIAPAMSIMIMIRHGLLSNLELSERKERTVPYLIVLFYYALMLVVLWWRAPSLPGPVFSMIASVMVVLVCGLLINRFWKISVHMMAQGGWTGTLLASSYRSGNDLVFYISLALFIAGMVAYARVKLRAHTPAQVYAGFGLGTMVNAVVQLMAE